MAAVPANVKKRIDVDRLSQGWENLFSSGTRSASRSIRNQLLARQSSGIGGDVGIVCCPRTRYRDPYHNGGPKSSLSTPTKAPLIYSEVHYIDFSKEQIPAGNPVFPFLYKRQSFEHKREVRAISPLVEMKNPAQYKHGIGIPVDLNTLIEDLYVHPGAPA
jgi:hypothetical protein